MCVSFVSFFFKQKTAYEVRISDWSSDVCSSDLEGRGPCLATCRRTDLKDRRMEIGPIRNDDDHRAAVDEIRQLWNADAGSADEDRLNALATLADEYDRKRQSEERRVGTESVSSQRSRWSSKHITKKRHETHQDAQAKKQ